MNSDTFWLDEAQSIADKQSDCTKVKVGCALVQTNEEGIQVLINYGYNKCVPNTCSTEGCLRTKKYGENSKSHRNPDDCRAVHSEVTAIADAFLSGQVYMYNAFVTAYVTRYPCEACARVLCIAGVSCVVYGRQQEISDMTKEIFDSYDVKVIWKKDWDCEDTTN